MDTYFSTLRITRVLGVPLRLLLALFIALSSFSPLLTPPSAVEAAGSTRVMCENDPTLVACWRMENNVLDGGVTPFNDGTAVGSPTYSSTVNTGNALTLDGITQYVSIPDEASLDLTNAFTIAAWVYPVEQKNQVILKKAGTGTSDGFELYLGADSYAHVRINQASSGNTYDLTANFQYNPGDWIHVAATFDGVNLIVYQDGDPNILSASVTIGTNSLPLLIGADSSVGSNFNGQLDDVRVYGRALTSEEISTLASTAPPGDITPPAPPTLLVGVPGNSVVSLSWVAPADPDVKGYNLYRGTTSGVYGTAVNGSVLIEAESYSDTSVVNNTTYYYVVEAVDTSGNDSSGSNEISATPKIPYALSFDGINDYVTFGQAAGLNAQQFTLETWFYWTGGGVTTSTGTGGLTGTTAAYPLVTKGRGESETTGLNVNYFLGISGGKLAADFEAYSGGQNYPVYGATTITTNTWHHAAVTYNGSCWQLYLDGNPDTAGNNCPRVDPDYTSTQHAGLGTAMNSSGTTEGYFAGTLDEARIWNYARNVVEIRNTINSEVTTGSGLLARWGMNDGTGTTIANSVSTINGTLTNGPSWVTPGTPFNAGPYPPPAAPTGLNVTPFNFYALTLTWSDNSTNETGFEIYRSSTGAGGPFSLVTTTSFNTVSYRDSGLTPSTEYCYQVRAVNGESPSAYTVVVCAITPVEGASALQFDGSNDYVTFGPNLNATSFTLETWVKRAAGGATMTTGSLGLDGTSGRPLAYPVLTKGMGEGETPANINMNYFLGITSTGVIGADFEDTAGGVNHPAWGSTTVPIGEWHHIASTYNGSCWALYIDGRPDTLNAAVTACPNATSEFTSIQHAGLAAGIGSKGQLSTGYFSGIIDEARIWNTARTSLEIRENVNNQLLSGSGLIARWGLNEGSDTITYSSIGPFTGTLTNGPVWVSPGAHFEIITSPPTGLSVTPVSSSNLRLDWIDNSPNETGFQIERSTTGPSGTFSLLTTTAANAVTYQDNGLASSTQYCYRVRAINANFSTTYTDVVCASTSEGYYALSLNPVIPNNTYVTFGDPAELDLGTFTIETWFKRTGAGTPDTTGASGIATAIPLVTHGSPESDGSNVDANWVLVIDDTNSINPVIGADFEDMASGLNHPVSGVTTIMNDTWYHAAATYDGTTWRLYLNGVLEKTLYVGATPRSDTIQRAALGTMIRSGGTANGFFQGVLDEARVWNRALSLAEIRATINEQITSGTGLVARWGLNENTGTLVQDSLAPASNGTITGSNFAWVGPAPFDRTFETVPPAAPTNLMASPGPGQVQLEWTMNSEPDLYGYNVYRSTASPVTIGTPINASVVLTPSYLDTNVTAGVRYYYAVTALDTSMNESGLSNEDDATPDPPPPAEALDLGSNHAYVALGNNADTATFTLEAWVRRDGTGATEDTGTGGVSLIPLITNGTSEAENAGADINYFFGLQSNGILCADFEEAQTGASPSLNHPVCGTHPLVNGTWYHVAATYDGTIWNLYLNGNPEATLTVGRPANAANTSQLAFGTAMETGGAATGFFDGALDEVRIWNYARSQAQIASTINLKLPDPQTGLLGRWGLDEGSGSTVNDTSGSGFNGAINNTGYTWIPGSPFNAEINLAPAAPTNVSPANGDTISSLPVTLSATVSDPEGHALDVTFYGRPLQATAGPDFTLVVIPDTQYYAATYPDIYNAQMQWVADNESTSNIVYLASLGDNVDLATGGNSGTQWANADTAYDILDTATVPYGVAAGNHDGAPNGTATFNTWFGADRYTSQPTYGGHYGSDNDNHYAFFSASGLTFIVIFIEYDDTMTTTSHPVLQWANNLLATNPTKRGIVISHNMLQGGTSTSFSTQGQTIYDALKGNANLDLMLGGHLDVAARRTDTNPANGNTTYTLRSDYQSVDSQQSGYLRIMRFSPTDDQIYVTTYSPTQNKFYDKSDAAQSNFNLSYPMDEVGFSMIGTVTGVSSGGKATVNWSDLNASTTYEWFAIATDGTHQTSGPTWNFTTDATVPVTLSYFNSVSNGSQVDFDWSTTTETANVGFNLYGEKDGVRIQLNDQLILSQAVGSLNRLDYTYTAQTDAEIFYIEDVDTRGETILHGPFTLDEAAGARLEEDPVDWASIQAEHLKKEKDREAKLVPQLKRDASSLRTGSLRGATALDAAAAAAATTMNLEVSKTGIYRVTYEMLRDAGLDLAGLQTKYLSLTNRGIEIPIRTSTARIFGVGGYIEFYGEALDTLYTDTNIYTIKIKSTSGKRITSNTKLPTRSMVSPAYYTENLTIDTQKGYEISAPGDDAWYAERMLTNTTPKSWSVPFQISGLANITTPTSMDLVLWGGTDYPQGNDHHVKVSLNGTQLADSTFDGIVEKNLHIEIPAGLLVEGTNTLQITLPGDTGAKYDLVYLDKYTISYPHTFAGVDGKLTFTASAKSFKVTNLPSRDAVVYRWTQGKLVRLAVKFTSAPDGTQTASFLGDTLNSTYYVTVPPAMAVPGLEIARAKADLTRAAEYLVIAHPDFIAGLQPLVEARQAQGLTMSVVDVNDLYAQYSYGIFDPQAIKDYIKYAKVNLGTKYVLLVGGDTYDYRNYLGKGSLSFVPSLYTRTSQVANFVPVDPLYADVDGNLIPDLAIGRFPVRSTAEMDLMVAKTLAYQSKTYGKTAVFAADKQSGGISFKNINAGLAVTIPSTWSVSHINLDDTVVAAAKQQLITAMNSGTALINYTGHSAPQMWNFQQLFTINDVAGLTNEGKPFAAVQWGCWNTYYTNPDNNNLVQRLLFTGDKGAAVLLGATTLTEITSEQALGQLLTPKLVTSGMTIGQAVQEAKAELGAAHPELLDVLLGWSLMGDPALVIEP